MRRVVLPIFATTAATLAALATTRTGKYRGRTAVFALINQPMGKKSISNLINTCYRKVGLKETVVFADQLMYTGFSFATRAGRVACRYR